MLAPCVCAGASKAAPAHTHCRVTRIRALRRLQRGRFVFLTERDGPMTPKAFHALFARIGRPAELPFGGNSCSSRNVMAL